MCLTHYERWRKHGAVDDPQPPSLEERFWAKVDKSGPAPAQRPELGSCWLWTGWISELGYGRFAVELPSQDGKRKRKKLLAHRWAYERYVGEVPEDRELDHLCRNRACVNYERHLEPVTHRVNMLRGETLSARNATKTHCINGHEFSDANTGVRPSTGHRDCLTCRREREAKRDRIWIRGEDRGKPRR